MILLWLYDLYDFTVVCPLCQGIFILLIATRSCLKNKSILYLENLTTWKPIFKVFYSHCFSQNFIVHNCHIIDNNVLPKWWCLNPVKYLLDSSSPRIFIHGYIIYKNVKSRRMTCNMTITTNGLSLQKLLSWFGNWGTSRNFFAKIGFFPEKVTDFKCCHRKLHLRCNRIAGLALIRTTSLGKIASSYPITLSRVSRWLVVMFVGS